MDKVFLVEYVLNKRLIAVQKALLCRPNDLYLKGKYEGYSQAIALLNSSNDSICVEL